MDPLFYALAGVVGAYFVFQVGIILFDVYLNQGEQYVSKVLEKGVLS